MRVGVAPYFVALTAAILLSTTAAQAPSEPPTFDDPQGDVRTGGTDAQAEHPYAAAVDILNIWYRGETNSTFGISMEMADLGALAENRPGFEKSYRYEWYFTASGALVTASASFAGDRWTHEVAYSFDGRRSKFIANGSAEPDRGLVSIAIEKDVLPNASAIQGIRIPEGSDAAWAFGYVPGSPLEIRVEDRAGPPQAIDFAFQYDPNATGEPGSEGRDPSSPNSGSAPGLSVVAAFGLVLGLALFATRWNRLP